MGQIWVKQFGGGLDVRRMPETTPGGSLLKAVDGHINRGGDFEERAAFRTRYTLPAGTVGLAYDSRSLVVFGAGPTPAGMPSGVRYQRLVHPTDPDVTLLRINAFQRAEGRMMVAAEFSDGTYALYYDGDLVDWPFDGRARCTITVASGTITRGVFSHGAFDVVPAGPAVDLAVSSVTVNGVRIIPPGTITGSPTTIRQNIADAINERTSSPDYTATTSGTRVFIAAAAVGPEPNGYVVTATPGNAGTVVANIDNMAGGTNDVPDSITAMTVNGVGLINRTIRWKNDPARMATEIAAAVNAKTADTGISAKAFGADVILRVDAPGTDFNGDEVVITKSEHLELRPNEGATFSGGLAPSARIKPGRFLRTLDSKVYTGSKTFLVFSGVGEPTRLTTGVTGAGFIDYGKEFASIEELQAIASFQNYAAVFAERTVLIWVLDPDPTLNKKAQILENTGTEAPNSVTQFGDSDLFYLDASGVRSLRSRANNNNASSTDIGVPIDALVQEQAAAMSADELREVDGLIDPRDGRFWLVMRDKIFVFSYFPGSKISAWSEYRPTVDVGGVQEPRVISKSLVYRGKIYLRSGDQILVYGGAGTTPVYDDSVQPETWLPYLDADTPAQPKDLTSVDIACEGLWAFSIGAQPSQIAVEEEPVRVSETTFNRDALPYQVRSTHFSARLRGLPGGSVHPRKVSALCMHYSGEGDAEQK